MTATFTNPIANPIASTSNNHGGGDLDEQGAQTSPLGLVPVSAATGDKGKRKRAERSVKPRKKQAKQKKRRSLVDEELDTKDNNKDEDEEGAETGSGEELTSNEVEELCTYHSLMVFIWSPYGMGGFHGLYMEYCINCDKIEILTMKYIWNGME